MPIISKAALMDARGNEKVMKGRDAANDIITAAIKSNQIKYQFLTLARFLSWLVEVEVAVQLQASPLA